MTAGEKRIQECDLNKKKWCYCKIAERPAECGQYLIAQEEQKQKDSILRRRKTSNA